MSQTTKLLTVAQLAERWGLTKQNLDARRSRGQPPEWIDISPPGSKRPTIRYELEEIERYERENQRNTTHD